MLKLSRLVTKMPRAGKNGISVTTSQPAYTLLTTSFSTRSFSLGLRPKALYRAAFSSAIKSSPTIATKSPLLRCSWLIICFTANTALSKLTKSPPSPKRISPAVAPSSNHCAPDLYSRKCCNQPLLVSSPMVLVSGSVSAAALVPNQPVRMRAKPIALRTHLP